MPESPPGHEGNLVAKLSGAAIVGRLIHRGEREIGFAARLTQVLARKFWDRILARPGLHRPRFPGWLASGFVLAVDPALDRSFARRRALGLFADCAGTRRFAH